MLDLTTLREEYTRAQLSETDVLADPLAQFDRWFAQAQTAQVHEPNAMTLATVDSHNQPHARIVLIKEARADGIVWFTNYDSAKGQELARNPSASLLFFWQALQRQVRINGVVEKITAAESDEYFHSRPLGSRIGAWASPQSQVLHDRSELEQRVAQYQAQFGEQPPRPEHWGGYLLRPTYFEFWQGRASRLHDRIAYQRQADGGWQVVRLAP